MVYTPAAAFEVGAEVYVMDADGNPQPASDGEYVLDGVTKIIVAGGMISEVEAMAAETEDEDMSDVISQLADRLTAIEAQLSETQTKLSTAETELAAVTKRATEAEAKVTQLSKTPVAGVKDQKFKAEPKQVAFKSGNKLADNILTGIQNAKSN
jgi:septal ring factor EnvC (AmiA/AmiB activator)